MRLISIGDGGIMVSIAAFQAVDPGSIPGHRRWYFSFRNKIPEELSSVPPTFPWYPCCWCSPRSSSSQSRSSPWRSCSPCWSFPFSHDRVLEEFLANEQSTVGEINTCFCGLFSANLLAFTFEKWVQNGHFHVKNELLMWEFAFQNDGTFLPQITRKTWSGNLAQECTFTFDMLGRTILLSGRKSARKIEMFWVSRIPLARACCSVKLKKDFTKYVFRRQF